jgi:hypothetical protein
LHARATLVRGLNDHRRERIPAHDRVAHGERRLGRRSARQELRNDQASRRYLFLEGGILRWVRAVDARADDSDGATASRERGRMCGGVYAGRETADHRNASSGKPGAQLPRLVNAVRCRLPGADDGDRCCVALVRPAAQEEHRRALVDHPQVGRIFAIENRDHPDPRGRPAIDVCRGLLQVVCRGGPEESPLGRRGTSSGYQHAAAVLQPLGHRGPDDLRSS